jgi:hypothetical protein
MEARANSLFWRYVFHSSGRIIAGLKERFRGTTKEEIYCCKGYKRGRTAAKLNTWLTVEIDSRRSKDFKRYRRDGARSDRPYVTAHRQWNPRIFQLLGDHWSEQHTPKPPDCWDLGRAKPRIPVGRYLR